MNDPIQFTPEEMSEFQSLSNKYQDNLIRLGQLYVNRIAIEERHNHLNEEEKRLKSEYILLQKSEEDLLARISAKYGDGNLDPKTGIFTPTQK